MLVERQAIALRTVGRKSVLSQNAISKVLPADLAWEMARDFRGTCFVAAKVSEPVTIRSVKNGRDSAKNLAL